MTGALGLRQVPRLGRMTAFGAQRKLMCEVSCFRFCPLPVASSSLLNCQRDA